jgi:glutamine amidotransferase
MCRMLSYLGDPISVEELLYEPDNSFVKQSYNPRYMSHLLNLAGFGMIAWDSKSHNPLLPYVYRTLALPFYDENLRNLSKKIMPYCLLSHLRGVSYSEKQVVTTQNVHPFMFPGTDMALAHNGSLYEFNKMKFDLLDFIKPEYQKYIHGTTDTEWIYAVFISQLEKPTDIHDVNPVIQAIYETLKILQRVRYKHNIRINSPVNLFITNGNFIAATRFVFDFGWHPFENEDLAHSAYHSLWYTYGENYGYYDSEFKMKGGEKKSSIIIASEPLTENTTTWIEVPEYTLMIAQREENKIKIISRDISL